MAESFLVTGSLGCVGAWVVRLLVREGVSVVSLDAGTDQHRPRLLLTEEEMGQVTWAVGDITDLGRIEAVIDENRVTNVIHLAALQMPFCRANPPLGAAVNVVGMVNVLEAARRRMERMAPVVYAGSLAMFGAEDAAGPAARLRLDAVAHPPTHYGVYKQANEGNARIYWTESGLPSVGLRPMTVFGAGRDQGMTSGPTKAAMAAVLGRPFVIPFGGRTLYNYAEDTARAFIIASRSPIADAALVNLPGSVLDMADVVAAIEAAVPQVRGSISYAEQSLPFPAEIESDPSSPLPDLPVTPFEEAVAATVELFRVARAQGRLIPAQHGLPED